MLRVLCIFASSPLASGSAFHAATIIRCADCKIIERLDFAKLLLYVSEGTYTRGRTRNWMETRVRLGRARCGYIEESVRHARSPRTSSISQYAPLP